MWRGTRLSSVQSGAPRDSHKNTIVKSTFLAHHAGIIALEETGYVGENASLELRKLLPHCGAIELDGDDIIDLITAMSSKASICPKYTSRNIKHHLENLQT